jgi:hypothetical protein
VIHDSVAGVCALATGGFRDELVAQSLTTGTAAAGFDEVTEFGYFEYCRREAASGPWFRRWRYVLRIRRRVTAIYAT